MNKISSIALAIGFTLSTSAFAQDDFRQHDAHVHGVVEFNIAQDSNELLVEITAPGADVVGFEHAPETDAQKQALTQAIAQLKQPQQILTLAPAAKCDVEHIAVNHTLGHSEHHDHDHDHDHDHHDDHQHHNHQEKHADHHDEHHGHEGLDDHADHEKGGHGEFTIEYHYQCGDINKLNAIETTWFSQFPSTEKVHANVLTDTAQTAVELSPSSTEIKL
ncbi:zinc uptake protein ZrgA [Vibrio taketomensis]|uniref:zinc uptake protein ZrgA n=1 Tax=Vibrio taketomensis TaxID=2572923 RepID=UPI0013895B79|nr:DUF2796 domain-containing protein [Vibrio taketomensis]